MTSEKGQEGSSGKGREAVGRPSAKDDLVPPDGGWGWVVVFGSSLLMFVNTSISYCFGMVYLYLVQSGYTNTVVAIIPALRNGSTNLFAPVATALSRYYSHRSLAITGNITVSIGLLMCSLYDHVIWFYIFYGIVIGVGYSFLNSQGFLLSQKYFHRRRVAANGLSMLGGSLGFMVFPLILNYFVQEYSYKGAFVLWAGVVLHGIIGASLFQPVEWHMKRDKEIPLQALLDRKDCNSSVHLESGSKANNPTTEDETLAVEAALVSHGSDNHSDSDQTSESDSSLSCEEDQRAKVESSEEERLKRKQMLMKNSQRIRTDSCISNGSLILGSFDIIDSFDSSISVKNEDVNAKTEENKSNGEKGEKPSNNYCLCCGIILPRPGDIINFSLLKHPAFLVSAFSSIFNRMVYMCFVTYLPSIAHDMGIQENAMYLFSCIAIFELMAKLFASLVSDLSCMPRRYYIILTGTVSSISIFSITFVKGFWGLVCCCSSYGFCVGMQMSIAPVLLIEYLGLKLLPYTYGLLLFMNGIGGLMIFCLTGVLNDLAGNYLTTYWGLGCLSLFSPIMWSTINYCPNTNPKSDNSVP